MQSVIEQYLWIEKYRPKTVSDMVLPPEYAATFTEWIQTKNLPSVLFVGRPGSGKSSIARILVDSVLNSRADLLMLNGSAQRGIDVVRERIEEFLKTVSMGGSRIKIVFIDEFDFMTVEAQAALRSIIETFSNRGRFVLTANYKNKISKAIQSRMQTFEFKTLSVEKIREYVTKILTAEGVTFNESAVAKLVNAHHPDIRKIVGILQSRVAPGSRELICTEADYGTFEQDLKLIVSALLTDFSMGEYKKSAINRSIIDTHKLITTHDVDYQSIYEELLAHDRIPIWSKPLISEYYSRHFVAASAGFNFLAMLYGIIQLGKRLNEMDIPMA